MEKDESRIGIDLADRLQGEEVVRAFQDPAARADGLALRRVPARIDLVTG